MNEHGVSLGGGGHTNKCNFVEDNEGMVASWKARSFPIPIVISKDLSNRRKEIKELKKRSGKLWEKSSLRC